MPFHVQEDYYYDAGFIGHGPGGPEGRNYFVFDVPLFSVPLVGAELRLYAGEVNSGHPPGPVPFELHSVATEPALVVTRSDYESTFDDLGDGTVLGRRGILLPEGKRPGNYDHGALIRVPLNADGVQELTQKQGEQIVFGGAVPNAVQPIWPLYAFGQAHFSSYPVQLVLYFSDAGPAEIRAVEPVVSHEVLATDRFNLSATVCGKPPLVRQWFKGRDPVPNATNDVLEIRSMSQSDAGDYSVFASNEFGIESLVIASLQFAPLQVSSAPQAIFVGTGDPLVVYFPYTTRVPASAQWRKNGTNIAGHPDFTFYIPNATPADSGLYDVVMYNSFGSRTSGVATVTVGVRPPRFLNDFAEYDVKPVGAQFDIAKYVSGDEPIYYQWYRDGQEVPGANSNYLRIASLGFADAGAYQLVATNAATGATSEVYQLYVEPFVIYNATDQQALVQNPFNFNTYIDTFFPVTVQWYFNGEPIPGATNMTLGFAAVDFTNAGPYFLTAYNAYGAKTSEVFNLTVTTAAPWIYMEADRYHAWVGADLTIRATTSGGPPPSLQWFLNNALIPGATSDTLHLNSVTTNQTGRYTLVASNEVGTAEGRADVYVAAEAPFFLQVPGNSNFLAGDFVTLHAKAVAGPPPTYQWRRDGVDLPGQTNTALLIGQVDVADSAVYEIVARNELGETRYTIALRVSAPTGLDRWKWRLPQAQGSRLFNIVEQNGRYVAAGKAGNIITSTDSVHWTSVTVPTDDLRALAAGNGIFVAAGPSSERSILTNLNKFPLGDYYRYTLGAFGVVLVSSNGVDWAFGNQPDLEELRSIAFGNGVFVATGNNYFGGYFCYTSVDGRHWTGQYLSGVTGYQPTFGNGRFLIVGSDGFLRYSTNGKDWTNTGTNSISPMFFGNGRFIGFGPNGMYESTDGVGWLRIGPISGVFPQTFAAGGGLYVGGLWTPGYASYSSDAAQWTAVDTGTRQQFEGIIYANGQFLAVGEAGTISRSVDGRTWTSDEVANKIDFYGVTDGNGLRVVAGDAGTILTSSNGVDWLPRSTPTTRNLHAVAYADGLFVAGGRGGALMTGPDGINWTARESRTTNYIERIAWANGLWVAVTEYGHVTTSSNGVDWTLVNYHFFSTDHEGVAYGNGTWVVVGGYFNDENNAVDTIFSSPDGQVWTLRPSGAGKRWRDVTFGNGKFVAIGNDGAMGFSTNGTTWSVVRFIVSRENLRRVHYANGRFIAVGNNGTLLSSSDPANGLAWIVHRSHTSQNLHDIHAGPDGTLVYVGNNGMVLQSGDTRPRFLAVGRDGRLEFDPGIVENLRLERSLDLRTWETEAVNVSSPHMAPVGPGNKFWRLAGE